MVSWKILGTVYDGGCGAVGVIVAGAVDEEGCWVSAFTVRMRKGRNSDGSALVYDSARIISCSKCHLSSLGPKELLAQVFRWPVTTSNSALSRMYSS